MKLNRKGYLTVEVILASVAAIGIAFFLMEITIRLVNITDDTVVDSKVLTDKALLIDNLKSEIQKDIDSHEGIHQIQPNNDEIKFHFCDGSTKSITINGNKVQYSTTYTKEIDDSIHSLILSSPTPTEGTGYKLFRITGESKFSKNNFEAEIIVYNKQNDNCE